MSKKRIDYISIMSDDEDGCDDCNNLPSPTSSECVDFQNIIDKNEDDEQELAEILMECESADDYLDFDSLPKPALDISDHNKIKDVKADGNANASETGAANADNDYPYQNVLPVRPRFASRKYIRESWIKNLVPEFPTQSVDVNDPVKCPFIAKFKQRLDCEKNYFNDFADGDVDDVDRYKQGLIEDCNKDNYIVVLGVSEDLINNATTTSGKVYCVFLKGCKLWEHYANIGNGNNDADFMTVFPHSTLSAIGAQLYGRSSNGWHDFVLVDENSPYHDKPLSCIRLSEKGPGFQNCLANKDVHLAMWKQYGSTKLNTQANSLIIYIREFFGLINSGMTIEQILKTEEKKQKQKQQHKSVATAVKINKKREEQQKKKRMKLFEDHSDNTTQSVATVATRSLNSTIGGN